MRGHLLARESPEPPRREGRERVAPAAVILLFGGEELYSLGEGSYRLLVAGSAVVDVDAFTDSLRSTGNHPTLVNQGSSQDVVGLLKRLSPVEELMVEVVEVRGKGYGVHVVCRVDLAIDLYLLRVRRLLRKHQRRQQGDDKQRVAMRMGCMASWTDESLFQRPPSEDRGCHRKRNAQGSGRSHLRSRDLHRQALRHQGPKRRISGAGQGCGQTTQDRRAS